MSEQIPLDLTFDFEGHPFHAFLYDGRPAFLAQDVAVSLDLTDASKSLRDSSVTVKGEDYDVVNPEFIPQKSYYSVSQRSSAVTIVYESGLYALIFRSRKPAAMRFTRWVIREVLPELRQTGSYSLVPADFQFDSLTRIQMDLIKEAGRGNDFARAILESKGLHPAAKEAGGAA